MTELLEAVTSWRSLLLVLLVFGFAPGFCLRLIVLVYPRSDPRRAELVAELYAVPRIQRPVWVAEQLEIALFEGLAHRVSAAIRWLTERRARAQTGKRGVWRGESHATPEQEQLVGEDAQWVAAEVAVAEGYATPGQEELVRKDGQRRANEARRRAWEAYQDRQVRDSGS